MISVREMRIGNWFYVGDVAKYPMYIVALGSDWVYLDFPGNEGDVWEAEPGELYPIPATEYFKKEDLKSIPFQVYSDYVHQVQNYLSDCGHYVEIKKI